MSAFALESREFLSTCLREALEDPDLVDAISDQALEHGLTALSIGQGMVTVDQLKDKLYLTIEEAKAVLNICASMVDGNKTGDKEQPSRVSLRLNATTSGNVNMRVNVKEQLAAAQSMRSAPETDEAALQAMMENAAVVVVSRTTSNLNEKKSLGVADATNALNQFTFAPVEKPCPAPAAVPSPVQPTVALSPAAAVTTPIQSNSPSATPRQRPSPSPAPKPPVATPPEKPSPAPSTTLPARANSPATTPRDWKASPAKSATPKPLEINMASENPSLPSPQLASPSTDSSPFSAPSYLRPTFAHKARISKETESSPNLEPVPEDPAQQRRRNMFGRMASTLLAPTQAFVARVTGRSEEMKSKKETSVSKASMQLEAVLTSPQGQRVTKPQPFMLRSEMRGKSCVLSTEDLLLAEAREKVFKRNPVPKHVYEQRPIVPTQRSTPKDPAVIFEPFQLESEKLHQKKIEELRKKNEEEAAREEEARRFKARAFDPRIAASPVTPPKPAASPPTKASAPVFASEARIAHYHEVIEPAKKAKEAELNKEKIEAERKAKEVEDLCVEDFRKTLEFKARPMPDFSTPFRIDPSLAKPVTSPAEPKLHTDVRLGTAQPVACRKDLEGSGLGPGVYDGAGYVDPFAASLRKSTSVSSGSKPGSAKRVNAVRQSASATYTRSGPGSGGLRSSVGASLQAAIRAAARDAARDLSVCPPVKEIALVEADDVEEVKQPALMEGPALEAAAVLEGKAALEEEAAEADKADSEEDCIQEAEVAMHEVADVDAVELEMDVNATS